MVLMLLTVVSLPDYGSRSNAGSQRGKKGIERNMMTTAGYRLIKEELWSATQAQLCLDFMALIMVAQLWCSRRSRQARQ